jgi:hypothetical protein
MTPFEKYNFFKLTIIEDSIENVLLNFTKYLSEDSRILKSSTSDAIDFDVICNSTILDYNGDFKFMLYEPQTNPEKTVFFSNLLDGWYTAVYNYARIFKKDVFQIGLTVDNNLDDYPAYFFSKFSYNDKNEFEERVIRLIKETNWDFYENSDLVAPLHFENVNYYRAKRKTNRLSKEIILEYLNLLGYNLKDINFFETKNVVFYCNWQ